MIISSLINSFILTLIIEYIIIKFIFVRRKIFTLVLLVNMLTNPLVVYIYNIMSLYSFAYKDVILMFLELLVVIVEGYVYKYLLETYWEKALIVSFISNILAYLIGALLNLYI